MIQTGQYDLPGGTVIKDLMMISTGTWKDLIRVEQWGEESQDEADETDTNNQIVVMNPKTNSRTNTAQQKSKETVEDPDFDEYYDVEEKDKDEDDKSETSLNTRASTYVCVQASSQIGGMKQLRSCPVSQSE